MTAWNDQTAGYDPDQNEAREVDWGVDAPRPRRQDSGPLERVRTFVRSHPRATLAIAAGIVTLACLAILAASRRRRSA